jgi:hypothetical protein
MTAARRSGCRKSTEAPFGNVIENLAGFLMPMPKRQEISANLKTNALRKPQSSRAKEDPGDKTRPHLTKSAWLLRKPRQAGCHKRCQNPAQKPLHYKPRILPPDEVVCLFLFLKKVSVVRA